MEKKIADELQARLQQCWQQQPLSVQAIKAWRATAIEQMDQHYRGGAEVWQMVRMRARLVDQLLCGIWQHGWPLKVPAALVAVGGYGRGELHPFSDIDILLLVRQPPDDEDVERIRQFITFLWDIGLEVGHSVRTPADCQKEAKADVTVMTNLMESRYLAGEKSLLEDMNRRISPARIWKSKAFYRAKMEERAKRYERFDDTAYALEPNLKEGPGGLRDIQLVGWIARRHYGVEKLDTLVEEGILTREEIASLKAGRNKLWEIRYHLHKLAGRRDDRISFDAQRQLAQEFGYSDQGEYNLAVEQFMQSYFRAVTHIRRICDLLLQHFEEVIEGDGLLTREKVLDEHYSSYAGYLQLRNEELFEKEPFRILEMFLVLQREGSLKGLRANTQRLMYQALKTRQTRLRKDPRSHEMFMRILRQKEGVFTQLQNMNQFGVLAAYLEEFGHIVGRMQYDLFHIYTVDQHTLFVIRNMRRFSLQKYREQFPYASQVVEQLNRPELLYLAGLFHDIAKGRGGDHSELGAEIALAYARRAGMTDVDGKLVAWLVRNHLLFSVTAQREDISDPEVIHRFAHRVGDMHHLNYLFVLTVADIWGTNPDLWNSWRASLLRDLYASTRRALLRGLENPLNREERIETARSLIRRDLREEGPLDEQALEQAWKLYPESAFIRFSVDQAEWHTRLLMAQPDDNIVAVRYVEKRATTEIVVVEEDRKGLFVGIMAALDKLRLHVVHARLQPLANGRVLDMFVVLDPMPADAPRLQQIRKVIRQALEQGEAVPPVQSSALTRKHKQFGTRILARFYPEAEHATLLELVLSDRPRLLSQVAQAFHDAGMRVLDAKITTFGDRVEDYFLLQNHAGEPLNEVEQEALEELLHERLDYEGDSVMDARTPQHNIERL